MEDVKKFVSKCLPPVWDYYSHYSWLQIRWPSFLASLTSLDLLFADRWRRTPVIFQIALYSFVGDLG